ncbi:MAG: hypothetical protein MK135_15845, partial [Polyangiaceae bacterium]|nr:hypothetical protein [Polyangiaceae bacterium]
TSTCASTTSWSGCGGHYTQVVWSSSIAIGCAQTPNTIPFLSGSAQGIATVCQYGPGGNFGNQSPYE